MGDTGSMIVGFMLAFFAVSFIADVQTSPTSDFINSAPVIPLAVLFFPLLDTVRIFLIRIFVHKTSPFKADRNHIHHRLLDMGYSHLKATIVIVALNLSVVILALVIKDIEVHLQLACISCFGIFLFLGPFMYKLRRKVTLSGDNLISVDKKLAD